jgi:hypothetical protein
VPPRCGEPGVRVRLGREQERSVLFGTRVDVDGDVNLSVRLLQPNTHDLNSGSPVVVIKNG